MIDVKQAVKAAQDNLLHLIGDAAIANLLLEEVELTQDEKYWLITLGYEQHPRGPRVLDGKLLVRPQRTYKVFKIDAETGAFVSMKIHAHDLAG